LLNGGILCLAFDNRRRADLTRARGWRWAFGGFRAFNFGTARTGARRTFAFGLVAFAAVQNCRHWLRNRTLQYIIA
jgi:hypothetical protein